MPESNPIRSMDLEDDLRIIRDAAEEAGQLAMKYFKADPDVWMKEGQSPVTEADLAVDRLLRQRLRDARPGYGWLSEESDRFSQPDQTGRTFIIDPIDGTRAFIDGKDVWCVSVAITEGGKSIAGVLNCPARDEEFIAVYGGGAHRNGTTLSVAPPADSPYIGGPSRMIKALVPRVSLPIRESRYVPSLAYRVAMVASGELDATFVKPNAHDWDIAAADVILSEAGGMVLDARQKAPYYAGSNPRLGALAAGSGTLIGEMASILSGFD